MDKRVNFRTGLLIVIVLVLALLIAGLACGEKQIKVRTGTRIVCKYGDLIKDDTRLISVPASEASKYSVRTVRRLCKKHKKIENLYRIAQQALSEGNETEAKKAVDQIIEKERELGKKIENAGDTKTKVDIIGQTLLESERRAEATITLTPPVPGESQPPAGQPLGTGGSASSTSGSGQTSSGTQTPGGSQPGPSPAPANLLSILPSDLPGYSLISEGQSVLAASRLYSAFNNPRVRFLTIAVQQFGNTREVQDWIDNTGKLHHSVNPQYVRIGNSVAYFGTDGREFAYVGWAKDSVMVELEMLAKDGVSPAELYDDIIDAAKKI